MSIKRDDRLVYYDKLPKDENGDIMISMSKSELYDYYKCANDILHFAENHCYIYDMDKGNIKIKLYEWQKEFLNNRTKNKEDGNPYYPYYILMAGRRSGKTVSSAIYLLHNAIFYPADAPRHIMIMSVSEEQSQEVMDMIKAILVTLPKHIQRPILKPNSYKKEEIEFYNGTWIRTATVFQSNKVRGLSITSLYVDEIAFMPQNVYDKFRKAVLATVASGKSFSITYTSTPDGFNHFYKIFTKAENGENEWKSQKVIWREIPEYIADDGEVIYRGEHFKTTTIANKCDGDLNAFLQEYECRFLPPSSSGVFDIPDNFFTNVKQINENNDVYKFWEHYDPNFFYTIGVDVGEGVGQDSSVIKVYKMNPIDIDNNEYFYDEVASYKYNEIDTYNFASIIEEFDEMYPNNRILVENNNHGHVTLQALKLRASNDTSNFDMDKLVNASNKRLGVMCTQKTKDLGFKTVKKLIRKSRLKIKDTDTFTEIIAYKGINHKFKEAKSDKELERLKQRDGLKNTSAEHDDTVMATMWAVYIETEIGIMDEIYSFYKMVQEGEVLTPEQILKKKDLFFLDEGTGLQSAKHNGFNQTNIINRFEGVSIEAYDMYGNSLINMDDIEDWEDFEDTDYMVRETEANDMAVREYNLFKDAGYVTNKKTPSVMDMYR